MFSAMMVVMMMEMNKFDEIKSVFVEYRLNDNYQYNISEKFPLVAVAQFSKADAILSAQSFQVSSGGTSGTAQLADSLGDNFDAYSPEELAFLQNFLCLSTQMRYHESEEWEVDGEAPYTIASTFTWNCKIMEWADENIRVVYSLTDSLNTRAIGTLTDSRETET
jgi:hypothetical protein